MRNIGLHGPHHMIAQDQNMATLIVQLCVAEIVSPKFVLTELDGRLGCLVLVVVLIAPHGLVAHPAFLAAALAASRHACLRM